MELKYSVNIRNMRSNVGKPGDQAALENIENIMF